MCVHWFFISLLVFLMSCCGCGLWLVQGVPKLTVRAGLALPAADFQANIDTLSAEFKEPISAEQAMSSLMYPKVCVFVFVYICVCVVIVVTSTPSLQVFSDFKRRQQSKGGDLLRRLPTPVYLYGLLPGHSFAVHAPLKSLRAQLWSQASVTDTKVDAAAAAAVAAVGTEAEPEVEVEWGTVSVTLSRVSALKEGKRTITWLLHNQSHADVAGEQVVEITDNTGKFVFAGPMADPAVPSEVTVNLLASPHLSFVLLD